MFLTSERLRLGIKVVRFVFLLFFIAGALGGCYGGCDWFSKPPVAKFSATSTSGEAPLEVSFDAFESYDPDGHTITCGWDFDDGNTAEGDTVQHGFGSPGSYTVRLLVTDSTGLSDTASKVISVSQPPGEQSEEQSFELQDGIEYDTGMGLEVSVPREEATGTIKLLVVEIPTPQQPAGGVVELHSLYTVSLTSEAASEEQGIGPKAGDQDQQVTLTFEIPGGVDPSATLIAEWGDVGWILAKSGRRSEPRRTLNHVASAPTHNVSAMGDVGGMLSPDNRYISIQVPRNSLTTPAVIGEGQSFALATLQHFGRRLMPPSIDSTQPPVRDGDLIRKTVLLNSPGLDGVWYRIDVEESSNLRAWSVASSKYSDTYITSPGANGPTYFLAPEDVAHLELVFGETGGHAVVSVDAKGCRSKTVDEVAFETLDWASFGVASGVVIVDEIVDETTQRFEELPQQARTLSAADEIAGDAIVRRSGEIAVALIPFGSAVIKLSNYMYVHFTGGSDVRYQEKRVAVEGSFTPSVSTLHPPADVTLPVTEARRDQTISFDYQVTLGNDGSFFTAIITPGSNTYHKEIQNSGGYTGELSYTAPDVGETMTFEIQGQMCSTVEGESNSDSETVSFTVAVASGKYEIPWARADSNGWTNPLGEQEQLITSTVYDYDSDEYIKNHPGKRHAGTDIEASPGSEVYAIAEGTVAKITVSSPENTVIIVKHTNSERDEFFAIYGHVRARNGLGVGTEVGAGEKIGTIVKSGSPSHLHFGVNTSSLLSSFIFGDHHGWGRIPEDDNLSTYNWLNPVDYLNSHNPSGSAPTLSVSLQATPSSGAAPMNVSLKATVSGTATGTINYTFYANRSDSGTNITSGWAAKFDGVTSNPKTAVLNYSSSGTYTAKVIVERGNAPPVEERVTITVGSAPTLDFTGLSPSTISTNQSTYQATLQASGSNFLNVNRVSYSWSGPDSGSMTWDKGDSNWNSAVVVGSDGSMTLKPVVLSNATGTQSQTWNWTVTLRDNTGATDSRSFTVTYDPPAPGIHVGDRVESNQNLNVRQCADAQCLEITDPDYIGYAPSGTEGTVLDGPESADGYTWWEVQWDAGYTGWSVENGLDEI